MDSEKGRWGNPLIKPGYIRLLFLFWVVIIGVSSLTTAGTPSISTNITTDSSLAVKIVDVSATIDVSQIGDIPLGQIPDERISITTSVVNTQANALSGLRIKTFLVKEGREDTISTQLGSDFRNVELKPGEVKVFTNNYMVSKSLKPGNYKVMIRIDSDDKGSNSFVQYISDRPVKIGAYAEAGGSVPIYSPSTIDNPGSYLLMREIQVGDRSAGIKISSSDVTIDGGGHTIQGISTGFTSAIYADGGNTIKNINIRNCVFEGVDFGVWFYRIESGSIVNCTFKNCKNIGIRLDQSRSISISDNILENNIMGIGVFQSVGNKIFNNYMKNQFNAAANDEQRNFWNSERQAGTNIAGGSTIGGNVWLDLNGTGYSASSPDQNHDGIIDVPYTINANNIDYYPISIAHNLTAQPSVTQTPNISIVQTESLINISNNLSTSTTDIADNQSYTHDKEPINASSHPNTTETVKKESIDGYFAELVLSNLNATDSVCRTSGLPVTCVVENIGDLGAKYFSVHYYLSDDQVISGTDKELGYHMIENLNPHDKQELTDTLQIPVGTPEKLYFIGAIVDPSNDIYEKDKINNTVLLNHRVQIKDC